MRGLQQKAKKLLLLDGLGLIYRSYYALHRFGKKNLPLTIMNFFRTFLKIRKKYKPSSIIMTMDKDRKTWRHQLYIPYKSHRPPQPAIISEAIVEIEKLFNIMQITFISFPGYEADDLIASIVDKTASFWDQIVIVSLDKDLMQLVHSNIIIYSPSLGKKEAMEWDEKKICKHWGIQKPSQIIDILALWGDASDHIPGVPLIGEKWAKMLIHKYQTLESVYDNLDDLKGRIKNSLMKHKKEAFLYKQLVTLINSLPEQQSWNCVKEKKIDFDNLEKEFERLSLFYLKKQFRKIWGE